MEPVRCFTCGFPIGNIKDAFDYMRRLKLAELREKNPQYNSHVTYNAMNPFPEAELDDVFEALGVERKKYCCKTRLVSNVQFHDLEIQDRF